ncbi:hypothetical protein ACIRP0_31610 [Streptomyces sp. NPDC101733]|uniref:hypothetical protein n=1 Tax=unclassified Streptomyces TaxID=2593676 RepID=UPI003808515D
MSVPSEQRDLRRRLPRLRYAARHPWDVVRRSGFGAGLTLTLLLFVAGWVVWLLYVYAARLS